MIDEPTTLFELLTGPDLDAKRADRGRLDVRHFIATEAISTLFQIRINAHHTDASLAFDEIVGAPAVFRVSGHGAGGAPMTRTWTGIVSQMQQTRAVEGKRAYSTYELVLVPRLWLLSQRRNYRIFQYKTELAIALEILKEWEIVVELRVDPGAYRARKYKVQYGETDYEFVYRVLSEVGISFFFEMGTEETKLVLADAPHQGEPLPLPFDFEDSPNLVGAKSYVTDVRRSQRVRPNAILLRDRDYRRDSHFELQAGAKALDHERRPLALYDKRLELFYYPENFNFVDEGETDQSSPYADSRGLSRTDAAEAQKMALIDLAARRNDFLVVELESGDLRLSHGVVFRVQNHPADAINDDAGLLVVESRISGRTDAPIAIGCEAVPARWPYRPTLAAKPRIIGLESATVVGVAGEEIDCDEFGRVKVHFHWDRYSKRNEESSCWIPVSQTWGGPGMGGTQIPRIGHEVLVEFLAGDPDRPIITGRVFTAVNQVPLKLPLEKTRTTLQSQSTGGGGGHNMFRMEDRSGNEEMYLRAEKDKNVQVNNDCSTNVGSHRRMVVGKNHHESVKGSQNKRVGGHKTVAVRGTQATTVTGDVFLNSDSSQIITTKKNYGCVTTEGSQGYSSNGGFTFTTPAAFLFRAGDTATILMTPSAIVIDAPKVFINPGAEVMADVLVNGMSVEEATEKARKKQADADEAAASAKKRQDKIDWDENQQEIRREFGHNKI